MGGPVAELHARWALPPRRHDSRDANRIAFSRLFIHDRQRSGRTRRTAPWPSAQRQRPQSQQSLASAGDSSDDAVLKQILDANVRIGDTDSILGVYQLQAAISALADWTRETFAPWLTGVLSRATASKPQKERKGYQLRADQFTQIVLLGAFLLYQSLRVTAQLQMAGRHGNRIPPCQLYVVSPPGELVPPESSKNHHYAAQQGKDWSRYPYLRCFLLSRAQLQTRDAKTR
ncbi:hypothetical protein PCL_07382 [Purpureocillium lilacinum]|uniref:PD-(D/E)XK nuclease-like domain-containing protein n=1 Tax=Purpureocillium lilacinum TaxID=33203 RepID=A0A2U3DS52_PURLI|nr:hypothetical protein PCL_07382 [Purpureocillium lilacinum]